MMTNKELIAKAINVATNLPTVYVNGAFGCRFGKDYYNPNYSYNKKHAAELEKYKNTDPITFGFDCVCFVKGLLWGFAGDPNKVYGGAVYQSNGVPDITESSMLNKCSDVSTDFSKIEPGEFLWMEGHCGLYIGDGLGVEATPKWQNKVQITAVGNIGEKAGYDTRTWTKHGKLPYVEYIEDGGDTMYNIQLTQDVKYQDRGDAVALLQARICQLSPELEKEVRGHSFSNGKPDGIFGKGMRDTVIKVQARAGLTQSGACDAELRAFLNADPCVNANKLAQIKKIL